LKHGTTYNRQEFDVASRRTLTTTATAPTASTMNVNDFDSVVVVFFFVVVVVVIIIIVANFVPHLNRSPNLTNGSCFYLASGVAHPLHRSFWKSLHQRVEGALWEKRLTETQVVEVRIGEEMDQLDDDDDDDDDGDNY